MTTCIRICSAYSLRLSRRNVTNITIFIFIVIMTVIFQRYASRHHGTTYPHYTIGDYDYQPGSFLRDKYPGNVSYCKFNYGFPVKLDWKAIKAQGTPESGEKSPYRVIYNALTGTAYEAYSKYNVVTYVTHATPEFMYHVIEIARYWDGPISLSLYVPSYDIRLAMQVLDHLCHCYIKMDKVSVHLFYPKLHPPVWELNEATTPPPTTTVTNAYELEMQLKLERYHSLTNKTRVSHIQYVRETKAKRMMIGLQNKRGRSLKLSDCSGTETINLQTYRRDRSMIYPINVGRNIARNATRTSYFIVSDIEMVPSDGLAPKFVNMLASFMGAKKMNEGCIFSKIVFVVPLFEVERGVPIPRDKETLVHQIAANHASYFHQKSCTHCQRFPGLQTWMKRPSPDGIEPILVCRREYPYHRWEPLYFGTHKDPLYSEMLSWEGKQDKMTQMLELCLRQYKLLILDGGFFTHAATSKTTAQYSGAKRVNARRYLHIIDELKRRYRDRPQCRVR